MAFNAALDAVDDAMEIPPQAFRDALDRTIRAGAARLIDYDPITKRRAYFFSTTDAVVLATFKREYVPWLIENGAKNDVRLDTDGPHNTRVALSFTLRRVHPRTIEVYPVQEVTAEMQRKFGERGYRFAIRP